MMHATSTQPRRRAAFSLLEMVLSLSVLAVAFTAVGSVFVLATKVMPAPDSAEAASVDQSRALNRLIEDLSVARYITAGKSNRIMLVVDDRTGDGVPDRLSYAWSGIAGDPLTLSVNGSTPVTLIDDVRTFAMSATTETRTDKVLVSSEVREEQLWHSYTSPVSAATASITEKDWVGQVVRPTLPGGARSYTVSRVRFRARQNGDDTGETWVRVRPYTVATGTLGASLAEEEQKESGLAPAYAWYEVVFAEPAVIDSASGVAVTFEWKNNAVAADLEYDNAGGAGMLQTHTAGNPWMVYLAKGLLAEVYGTCTIDMPGVELTRTVVTQIEIALQAGAGGVQTATARLYCEPGLHSAAWDAGFEASPANLDMDGNGSDWRFQSGGEEKSFALGRWDVDGVLYTQPTHSFDEPLVVDLKMGATAAGRSGATFQINADQSDGDAVPITVRAGLDNAGSYCVSVYDTEKLDSPRLDATGLGDNPPEVRLLVVPADNAVGVIINGKPAGSFYYEPVAAGGLPGLARLTEGSDGFFDHVSIRVGASAVVTSPAGAESDSGSDEGGDGLVGGLLNGLLGR